MRGVTFLATLSALAVCVVFAGTTSGADGENSAAVANGMSIFHTKGNCQACHGWSGDGQKMDNQMPDGTNLRETKLDRDGVIMTVKCGRPDRSMPAFDKLAYTDDRCGVTQADLDAGGHHLDRAAPPLLPREIEQVADFLFAKVIGAGPMTREKCIAFWGQDAKVCKDL